MSFLKKIGKALFPTTGSRESPNYTIYARCNRCQEVLTTRVNLYNDLSLRDEGGYTSRKVLIGGNRCFQQIEVILHFDTNRNLTEREITGGVFVT
ncbi:MAG TPA: hypothetical protein G4N96_09100, partial [Chloroflexi bacterium]|nr:hypothetical protein [Chloroflexota bacterium]